MRNLVPAPLHLPGWHSLILWGGKLATPRVILAPSLGRSWQLGQVIEEQRA